MKRKDYESDDQYYDNYLFDEFVSESELLRQANHAEKYEKHKQTAAERQREQSEEGRDIGSLPACEHPELVEACQYDLKKFMLDFGNESETSPAFPEPFCEAQLYAIQAVQETLLSGGKRPLCLPRGFAKTTICEWGILWAIVYGHQSFVLIIAAKHSLATQILENIQKLIIENELLAVCFPALCYPIACLDGIPNRAPGQLLNGKPTKIKMNSKLLIAPTVPGAASSGAIITTSGLEGAIRGMKIGSRRPTAVILDDPQTEKSAASVTQTQKRWNLISGCIKGLSGPGTNLAMIATITVQNPEDLSERILKEWGGRRFSMLHNMPKNMELWQEYDKLRKLGILNHIQTADQIREANQFYLDHRLEMEDGAEAEWKTNYDPTELSAIQHAMNLYFDNKETFYAEYQNSPLALLGETQNLQYEQLVKKIISVPRSEVPIDCERVTVGIDIQEDCFYWTLIAWGDGFRGHVLDYGRFPSLGTTIFQLFPESGKKDAFYLGLMALCPMLSERRFMRQDGSQLRISKGLIDANRGLFTPQVRKACLWQAPTGSRGSLTLFDGDEIVHWSFLQHQLSERSALSIGPRGTIDKWVLIPGRENHLWDCVVMANVANSTLGGKFDSGTSSTTAPVVLYSGNWSEIAQ